MVPKESVSVGSLAVTAEGVTDEEDALLQRLSQGDATAFWGLWEQYKNPLFLRLCMQWMGGNREDAEDALSSASIRAWQYVSVHGHEIGNVKAWLTRLLYNHCMSLHKVRQQYLRYVQPEIDTNSVISTSPDPVQSSPEDAFLDHEMRMYVRGSIERLPPKLREPMALCFFQEMSQQDIATYLNLSYENVRKRLQHGRAMLLTEVESYLAHGDRHTAWDDNLSQHSPVAPLEAAGSVTCCVAQAQEAIDAHVVAMRTVRITLRDGVQRYMQLALDLKPGRLQQKAATLRAYVQQHPGGWRKQLQLANLLYSMGHWEEAMAAFHHVLYRQPRHLNARLRLGQMLHLLQRQGEAIAVYEGATASASGAATQLYVKGRIQACQGRPDAAARSHAAAAALEPRNVVHWRALGTTHLDADQPVEALNAFEAALEIDPDDLVALTESYGPLMDAGRYQEAQRRMVRAWQLDPGHIVALTRQVNSRCHMRHVRGEAGTQTRALIRRAMQLAPEALEVAVSRARYHMARGEWSTGLAMIQQYTAKNPNCPAGWYHYARLCFRTGASQSAADAILQAYVLDPEHAAISQAGCVMLAFVGRLEEAWQLITGMLQQFPNRWRVWATAGNVLAEAFQDKAYACTVSAQGPMLQPGLAQAWFGHGRVLTLAGKHREALAVLEQGWQRLPVEGGEVFAAPAALWLGENYRALGAAQKSREWWETAGQHARDLAMLDPAASYYWQGKVFEVLGQQNDARDAYGMALRHHLPQPLNWQVQESLQRP